MAYFYAGNLQLFLLLSNWNLLKINEVLHIFCYEGHFLYYSCASKSPPKQYTPVLLTCIAIL